MARAVLLVVVVVLVAAGAWFLGAPPDELDPLDRGRGATTESGTRLDAEADPGNGAANLGNATDDSGGGRTELPTGANDEAKNGVRLVVIDETTDRPVPDAEVLFEKSREDRRDLISSDGKRARELRAEDYEQFLREFGEVRRSNREGHVWIPHFSGFARVLGRFGELQGTVHLDSRQPVPPNGLELRIGMDLNITVLVVDANGQPASPIAVRAKAWSRPADPEMRADSKTAERAVWSSGNSTRNGIAVFRHLQNVLRREERSGENLVRIGFEVRAPGFFSPVRKFDRAQLADQQAPVRFQLPPTGTLTVRLLDQSQKPLRGQHPVTLHVNGGTDPSRPIEVTGRPPNQLRAIDGLAEFPFLAIDREYTVSATLGNAQVAKTIPGPRSHGDTVRVDLVLSDQQIILAGRAVDSKGEALPRRELLLEFDAEGYRGSASAIADARGGFQFFLSDGVRGRTLQKVRIVVHGQDRRPTDLSADLEPNQKLNPGTLDFRDVRFLRAPLLVSGLVTVDGEPARPDVNIFVEAFDPERPAGRRWQRDSSVTVTPEVDGRFEARGHSKARRLRIGVTSFLHQRFEPMEFARGTTDLIIALSRGGALRAEVLTSTPLPEGVIRIQARPSSGEPDFAPFHRAPVQLGHGSDSNLGFLFDRSGNQRVYDWASLRPGRYDLLVLATGHAQPLHRVDGVVVKPGKYADDSRIHPIDLREVVKLIKISLRGPDGKPLEARRGGVFAVPDASAPESANTRFPMEGQHLSHGMVSFLIEDSIHLRCIVPGYKGKLLTGVTNDRTVTLEPHATVPITIQLSTKRPDLPKGIDLAAHVQSTWPSSKDKRQYVLRLGDGSGTSGQLEHLLNPVSHEVSIQADGKAVARVRTGIHYIVRVYLTNKLAQIDVAEMQELTFDAARVLRFDVRPMAATIKELTR